MNLTILTRILEPYNLEIIVTPTHFKIVSKNTGYLYGIAKTDFARLCTMYDEKDLATILIEEAMKLKHC